MALGWPRASANGRASARGPLWARAPRWMMDQGCPLKGEGRLGMRPLLFPTGRHPRSPVRTARVSRCPRYLRGWLPRPATWSCLQPSVQAYGRHQSGPARSPGQPPRGASESAPWRSCCPISVSSSSVELSPYLPTSGSCRGDLSISRHDAAVWRHHHLDARTRVSTGYDFGCAGSGEGNAVEVYVCACWSMG